SINLLSFSIAGLIYFHKINDPGQAFNQFINFSFRIVNSKGSPYRSLNVEALHQRFSAMVAGPYCNSTGIQHLADVEVMYARHGEGEYAYFFPSLPIYFY